MADSKTQADAAMTPLGEIDGIKWYWAGEGFVDPGPYYWNGETNINAATEIPRLKAYGEEQFRDAHDLRIMLNDRRQRTAELETQNSQLIEPPASIKFHDHDGREREIVYEQGDWDVGIPSGYRISENDKVGDEVELAIAQLASVAQQTRRLNSDSALGRGCGVHDLANKAEGALKVLREVLGIE